MDQKSQKSRIEKVKKPRNPATSEKQIAWQRLGDRINGREANRVRRYLDELWREGKKETYFDNYLKLLQYFKPKIQAHAIKQQTEIIFKFEPNDKDLIDDI